MRVRMGWVLLLASVWVATHGCSKSSEPGRACVPGASQSCAGPGDCAGYQVCNADGSGFDPCDCEVGSGSGGSSSGGTASSGSTNSGATSSGATSSGSAGEGGETSEASATANVGGSSSVSIGSTGSTGGAAQASTNESAATNSVTTGSLGAGGAAATTGMDSTTTSAPTGGSSGTAGVGGVGGSGGTSTTSTTGSFCAEPPIVFVLVDASSSMWDNMFWDRLRQAVLGTILELQTEIQFGFGTFSGLIGATCPVDFQSVASIDLNNHDPIAAFYDPIMHPGVVHETPTAAGLHMARERLASESGKRAILLVTDGNPDFCDNGDAKCRADVLVRVIQNTHAEGIDVLVAGLPDPGIDQTWLTAFANAGLGEPVIAPSDTAFCSAIPADTATLLGIAPDAWPSASYGAVNGNTTPISLDPADVDASVALLVQALTGWAACE